MFPGGDMKMNLHFTRVKMIIGLTALMVSIFAFQNCAKTGFEMTPLESVASLSSSSPASTALDIKVGILRSTAAGNAAGLDVEGRMMMVRDPRGNTKVYLQAAGLNPAQIYASHVHDQSCAVGGGAHYKIDNTVTTAVPANEFWPLLGAIGADGVVLGSAEIQHIARPEAQSVVIHAADNTRLACGLFYPQYSSNQKGGTFTTLAGGTGQGKTITGSGVLIRNGWGGQTILRLSVAGLAATTTYMAHVHNQPCAMGDGGVHYKQSPGVTEVTASAANEIWASLTTDAAGMAQARTVVNGHVARADAMSVVIHDPVTPATRLACVDLAADGGLVSTSIGLSRMRNVTGVGLLERLPNGQTKVSLTAAGLLPNTQYMAHVHDRPCHIAAGGGHYKIDPLIATPVETNELWLKVLTDVNGAGTNTILANHLARPEAQSIVIHDPIDAARLACVDLH